MTVTNTSLQTNEVAGFTINSRVTSASAEIIKAAPGAGKFTVLKEINISSSAAGTVTIESRASATATVTPIIGPISMNSSNTMYSDKFIYGIRLPVNEELTARSSASALVNIFTSGTTL